MLNIIALLITFTVFSCQQQEVEELVSNAKDNQQSYSEDQFYGDSESFDLNNHRWSTSDLPLAIYSSDTFSAESLNEIKRAMGMWNTAAGNEIFQASGRTKNKEYQSTETYKDKEIGIYLHQYEHEYFKNNTLAVTNIFALQTRLSDGRELYKMAHADILLNGFNNRFSTTAERGAYDLRTVIIHELGHLAGIINHSETRDSVMYPTINLEDEYVELYPKDFETIKSMYSDLQRSQQSSFSTVVEENMVIIIVELKTNGKHVVKMIK